MDTRYVGYFSETYFVKISDVSDIFTRRVADGYPIRLVIFEGAGGEGLFLVSLRHLPTDDALRTREIERIKRKAERYGG